MILSERPYHGLLDKIGSSTGMKRVKDADKLRIQGI